MPRKIALAVAVLASAAARFSIAAELKPATLAAWDDYVRKADARARDRICAGRPLGPPISADQDARLHQGEILAEPLVDKGALHISDGLIHDWFATMFIPDATLEEVFAVLHDYDHYKQYFGPTVADSKALASRGTEQRFLMLWRQKVLFVDAALRGEYESRDFEVDARLWYSIARMTRVQEIENYGQPGEHLLAPDQGSGFLWRLHSIARYAERDGGVYVGLEVIALTRDVPISLRWLVTPVIVRLSRNSLLTSLRQTREAVGARPPATSAATGN